MMEFKTEYEISNKLKSIDGLKTRYLSIRQKTNDLCHPLLLEDYPAQPMVDVSPPKWHLGHTTWFFENFVLSALKNDYKPFDQDFFYLFNSYYESLGERLPREERGSLTRPPVEQIYNYRHFVDEAMLDYLDSKGEEIPQKIIETIELGLQHEQQHQELLITDIKYILGKNPLNPIYIETLPDQEILLNEHPIENYIEIPNGIYESGYAGDGFCFDNEQSRHKVYLESYRILDRLITNQEYLEFMEAGGYRDFKYWLQEGWQWVNNEQIIAPLYWQETEGTWTSFTLNGRKKINLLEPVTHVSYYEADAFARWKGKRLLTEHEWEAAANMIFKILPNNANFMEEGNYQPMPRKNFSTQMFGDVWEWCCSAFLPYPGFKIKEGAIGEYNGKFMINQMVLKGGSCATPQSHIRHSYRNFFHPDKRWQFTGIRLAETII